jgi:hypothetical protein
MLTRVRRVFFRSAGAPPCGSSVSIIVCSHSARHHPSPKSHFLWGRAESEHITLHSRCERNFDLPPNVGGLSRACSPVVHTVGQIRFQVRSFEKLNQQRKKRRKRQSRGTTLSTGRSRFAGKKAGRRILSFVHATVGAQGKLHGAMNSLGSVDLNATFQFGTTRDDYSAQFTRPIQTARPYYQQVLRSFGIQGAP